MDGPTTLFFRVLDTLFWHLHKEYYRLPPYRQWNITLSVLAKNDYSRNEWRMNSERYGTWMYTNKLAKIIGEVFDSAQPDPIMLGTDKKKWVVVVGDEKLITLFYRICETFSKYEQTCLNFVKAALLTEQRLNKSIGSAKKLRKKLHNEVCELEDEALSVCLNQEKRDAKARRLRLKLEKYASSDKSANPEN